MSNAVTNINNRKLFAHVISESGGLLLPNDVFKCDEKLINLITLLPLSHQSMHCNRIRWLLSIRSDVGSLDDMIL